MLAPFGEKMFIFGAEIVRFFLFFFEFITRVCLGKSLGKSEKSEPKTERRHNLMYVRSAATLHKTIKSISSQQKYRPCPISLLHFLYSDQSWK